MSKPINHKCMECAWIGVNNPKDWEIKPDCYHAACSRIRSYYRKHSENKEKMRNNHRYLKYSGDCCALCQSSLSLEVHHIQPQSKGGIDARFNLITLCKGCHKVITAYYRAIGWL